MTSFILLLTVKDIINLFTLKKENKITKGRKITDNKEPF